VRGKWAYYGVMNFLEYYLQRRTMDMFQRQQLQLKFHSMIRMKLKWEFWTTEGENIIHDQKMEGGSSKNEQPSGIKRGWEIQKLTLDSLKEIVKNWGDPGFKYPLQD